MITDQHRQEQLSRAYVHAVAAHAGLIFEPATTDYGVDGTIRLVRERNGRRFVGGHSLDVQLKATTSWSLQSDEVIYDVEAKTYNDLVDRFNDEPDEDKTIVGRVTRLRSDKPPVHSEEFELATRTIVVLWEVEKRQPLRVHIVLPLEQYRTACDAHKNGRKIKIIGKPRKVGKFWNLIDHHDFEVI